MENFSELFYDKKWCKVSYHSDTKAIVLEWIGFATKEQFQEACNASLDLLIDKQTDRLLVNNKQSKVVSSENQAWLNNIWLPKAYKKGHRKSAIVIAEDIFNQVAVKQIVNQMDQGKVIIQFFQTQDSALEWLKTA